MFTRSDFDKLDKALLSNWGYTKGYPGLYYITYPQYAFQTPDSEQTIRIIRAPKLKDDNGLRFWLSAEQSEDWSGRESYFEPYISKAAFEPIEEHELNNLIASYCGDLICQPALPIISDQQFIGGLIMYSIRIDMIVSVFAEYTNEFLFFYWDTTA